MAISRTMKGALMAAGFFGVLMLLILSWFSKTVSFEEEVQFSDGRKVLIRRSELLKRACEGFSCGWGLEISKIRLPDTPQWEFPNLVPLILEMGANSQPIILAKPSTCGDYVRMNNPVPPYLQFELSDSVWRRTATDRRFHAREANLLIAPDWEQGEGSRVTVAEKRKRNTSAGVVPLNRINLDAKSLC